jgi:integrase
MAKRGRKTTGFIKKRGDKYAACVGYTDSLGQRKSKERLAATRGKAQELLNDLLKELKINPETPFEGEYKTMHDLCEYFKKHYVREPLIRDGVKIDDGLKSYKSVLSYVAAIDEVLGKVKLAELDKDKIRTFKRERLSSKTVRGKLRSVASVNRECSYIRRMLGIAVEKGWLHRNPFTKDLIEIAKETKRRRVITKAEELRLIEAARTLPKCGHLAEVLILAFETGLRRKEILGATWNDVDFNNRVFHVTATNSKTESDYYIALSQRAFNALETVYRNAADRSPSASIFDFREIKRSWTSVRKHCGLEDVLFKDARRTSATRMAQSGVPLSVVQSVLGHRSSRTTDVYISIQRDASREAATALDSWNESAEAMLFVVPQSDAVM